MIIYPLCTSCILGGNSSTTFIKMNQSEDHDFWLVLVLEISLVLALVILSWHYGPRKRVQILEDDAEADNYENL